MNNLLLLAQSFYKFAQANYRKQAVEQVISDVILETMSYGNIDIDYNVSLQPDNTTIIVNVPKLTAKNPLYYTSTLKNSIVQALHKKWPNVFKVRVNFAQYPQHSS